MRLVPYLARLHFTKCNPSLHGRRKHEGGEGEGHENGEGEKGRGGGRGTKMERGRREGMLECLL